MTWSHNLKYEIIMLMHYNIKNTFKWNLNEMDCALLELWYNHQSQWTLCHLRIPYMPLYLLWQLNLWLINVFMCCAAIPLFSLVLWRINNFVYFHLGISCLAAVQAVLPEHIYFRKVFIFSEPFSHSTWLFQLHPWAQ